MRKLQKKPGKNSLSVVWVSTARVKEAVGPSFLKSSIAPVHTDTPESEYSGISTSENIFTILLLRTPFVARRCKQSRKDSLIYFYLLSGVDWASVFMMFYRRGRSSFQMSSMFAPDVTTLK